MGKKKKEKKEKKSSWIIPVVFWNTPTLPSFLNKLPKNTNCQKNWLTNVNVSFTLVTFCARTNFRTACCLIHTATRCLWLSNKYCFITAAQKWSFFVVLDIYMIDVSCGRWFDLSLQEMMVTPWTQVIDKLTACQMAEKQPDISLRTWWTAKLI